MLTIKNLLFTTEITFLADPMGNLNYETLLYIVCHNKTNYLEQINHWSHILFFTCFVALSYLDSMSSFNFQSHHVKNRCNKLMTPLTSVGFLEFPYSICPGFAA